MVILQRGVLPAASAVQSGVSLEAVKNELSGLANGSLVVGEKGAGYAQAAKNAPQSVEGTNVEK